MCIVATLWYSDLIPLKTSNSQMKFGVQYAFAPGGGTLQRIISYLIHDYSNSSVYNKKYKDKKHKEALDRSQAS